MLEVHRSSVFVSDCQENPARSCSLSRCVRFDSSSNIAAKMPPLRAALQLLTQKVQQSGFRKFLLRAVRQCLQCPEAVADFIVAQNQREFCAEFVGLAEGFA